MLPISGARRSHREDASRPGGSGEGTPGQAGRGRGVSHEGRQENDPKTRTKGRYNTENHKIVRIGCVPSTTWPVS